MKLLAFLVAELAIIVVLSSLLFIALLYQPTWIWISAAAVMYGALVAVPLMSAKHRTWAIALVLLAPLSYSVYPIVFEASVGKSSVDYYLWNTGFYAAGVVLLGLQLLLHTVRRQRIRNS